jgi:hypothetical protein
MNRKQKASILAIGFVVISLLARSWDDLVAHVAIGIAIGLVVASALFIPRERRTTSEPSIPSIPKTVLFWITLAVFTVAVYQLVRGPVH